MAYTTTPLYGGAITLDLPSHFTDASLIRQIPDHQEVYLDSTGYTSIIIEIVEAVEKSRSSSSDDDDDDEKALQFHFDDLVAGTGDTTSMLCRERVSMRGVGDTNMPILALSCIQTPPPAPTHQAPERKTPEYTFIQLLLIRLKEKRTDLLISINTPHYPHEYSPAAGSEPAAETTLMRDSKAMRQKVLDTFQIKDWGLFDG